MHSRLHFQVQRHILRKGGAFLSFPFLFPEGGDQVAVGMTCRKRERNGEQNGENECNKSDVMTQSKERSESRQISLRLTQSHRSKKFLHPLPLQQQQRREKTNTRRAAMLLFIYTTLLYTTPPCYSSQYQQCSCHAMLNNYATATAPKSFFTRCRCSSNKEGRKRMREELQCFYLYTPRYCTPHHHATPANTNTECHAMLNNYATATAPKSFFTRCQQQSREKLIRSSFCSFFTSFISCCNRLTGHSHQLRNRFNTQLPF